MQITHAEDSAQQGSIRGPEREFKTLLTGDETSPDNFRLYFVRQTGEVDIPRHKHNFDQIRMCLEGDGQNFGPHKWIKSGEIAYFPEGTPYGPEQSNTPRLSITLQFGGASGNGFVSNARIQNGMAELKACGSFEKGVFTRVGELAPGQKRNQDSFEAIWEHVNQRKLVYPKPRYGDPILMKPANFDWQAVEGQPGLSERRLAVLSERQLQLSMFKLEPNARGALRSRGGVHVGFVVEGGGAANGEALRKYSAFSGNEDLMLSSPGGMEFLLVGLPIFKAPAALLAAE